MRNKMKLKLTFLSKSFDVFGQSLLATAVLMSLTACGGSKWQEVKGAPNTGDVFAEKQFAPPASPVRTGDPGFISTEHLPVAQRPKQPIQDIPLSLERNDEIKVTNANPNRDDGTIDAVVVNSKVPGSIGKKVYPKKAYVAAQPVVPTNEENAADKYFVVQNIATEKLRVYANCAMLPAAKSDCAHKLVFETDMAAGRDTPAGRSLLGAYRITQWFKFYEDRDHSNPSFFAEGYPQLPKIGANLDSWLLKSRLPKGKGEIRGAFGWYTAHLGPNANDQWTHGTLGWGVDGVKFIDAAKDPSNLGKFERSSGCSRVENQAIALMRELLPVGTKVFKIYAKEGYADASRTRYLKAAPSKWTWILTKNGTMSTSEKSGAKDVSAAKSGDILDRGSYSLDQMPDAVPLVYGSKGINEENGNVYNVSPSLLKGTFLVDDGRVSGYEHPRGLGVGGQLDHKLPSMMISNRVSATAVKSKPAVPVRDSFE